MRQSLFIACTVVALFGGSAVRADSLWKESTGNRGMCADRKAARTGDIVTIVVSESIAAQSSQSKNSSRDSSVADAVQSFLYPTTGLHNGALPSIAFTGKAAYNGGGDVSNKQSVDSRAAALVTDVLPNGNLVIEGVRVVTFSGETQYVVLHGLVRADDVLSDNTVQSSNIAEARVEFVSEGTITDAQKRGWLSKVYEKLRPF
jgi:flagellar L-ring protein FlgH